MTLNDDAVSALRARLQREVDEGLVPACQFALARDGELLTQETFGETPEDVRFLTYSATKGVFVSLVWQLIGEGLLDPDAPVADLWPEFAAHGKGVVTLDHVLLHTAGLPYARLDVSTLGDRAARVQQMQDWSPVYEPGSRFEYHALSAHWILAELVARVTGQDYRVALRERILDPLGLTRLELGVPEERQGGILSLQQTGAFPTPEEIRAVLGVDSLDLPEEAQLDLTFLDLPQVRAAGVPGGGAVSDAASLALFYQAVLHDPEGLWDPAVLKDATTVIRNDLPHPLFGSATRTRGLEVAGEGPSAFYRIGGGATSPQAFGHGGAHGQIAWADPVSGLSFAFLTNGGDQHFIREFGRGVELNALAASSVVA